MIENSASSTTQTLLHSFNPKPRQSKSLPNQSRSTHYQMLKLQWKAHSQLHSKALATLIPSHLWRLQHSRTHRRWLMLIQAQKSYSAMIQATQSCQVSAHHRLPVTPLRSNPRPIFPQRWLANHLLITRSSGLWRAMTIKTRSWPQVCTNTSTRSVSAHAQRLLWSRHSQCQSRWQTLVKTQPLWKQASRHHRLTPSHRRINLSHWILFILSTQAGAL